ncbi:O-antigen ligase family protein [Methyloversatilis universalis]|uniref:O-antigen ligase family protein n=1 Tax=Methyloversatilis universalis TaxID=378211 RepID=UPI0002D71A15|nr:O-antigen ligase family protein [Methyloversatilis universalis]
MITAIFLALAVLFAVGSAFVLSFAAIRLSVSLRLGIFFVLGLFLVETWFVQLPAFSLGLNIYPQDLLFLGLAVIGAGRVVFGTNKCLPQTGWILFGFMLFVSLVIGYAQFKTKAGVDLRPTFYFWSTAFFISTFKVGFDEATRILKMYAWVGVLVLLIVVYRWLSDALGIGSVRFDQIGAGKPLRVLTAGQTYYLAEMVLFFAYMFAMRGKEQAKKWPWMVVPFGLAVLLLQHRSVWVATLVGLLVIYIGAPQLRERFRSYALVGTACGVFLLVPLLAAGFLDPVVDALGESVQEAFQTRNSTFTWRLQSTRELFMQWLTGGPKVHLIGKPFGSGYERYLEDLGHVTDYSPHNLYIQMLLRVGLIGTFGLLLAYVATALDMWKRRFEDVGDSPISPTPWAAVLVSSLIFFYPYGAHFVQGLFLGLAIALYRGKEKEIPAAIRVAMMRDKELSNA